jgi:LPXTG-motif cell wall-anchored protein
MRSKGFLLAAVALGVAALCFAQGKPYSTAPTDADYRLTIREPLNGATITGSEVQVVMSLPWVPDSSQAAIPKERADVMTPVFQIWVDGKDYGNLPGGQNVFVARDLSYGEHKIVVAAKNISGNVVDRKEIKVTTVPPKVAVSQTDQAPPPRPVAAVAPPPPPPPAPVAAPPPPPEPPPALPQTGTAYPGALVGGLGLILAGLALSRRRRS